MTFAYLFRLLCIYFLASILTESGFTQSIATQDAMHARIQAIYSFSPSKVTAEERESKSAEMDLFWKEVKSHKDTELPLLRRELKNEKNSSFFFADGSALLHSLSQSPEDEKLVAACLTRVDFDDFQNQQYLYDVHRLAINGIDISQAALHILDYPKFDVYLPEHAFRLDQSASLLEMLLPLPESVWLPSVMQRVKTEHDQTAQRSLLLLLYYAQTDEADAILRSIEKDQNASKVERDFTGTVVKHERELGLGKLPSRETELRAREERRKRMFAVSDEAMDDLEDLTRKIAQARIIPEGNR